MEEKQITSDGGETRKLNLPFMVLATQNPIESYGTFPLPEAQLDRFFMRLKLGYPTKEEEKAIINKNIGNPLDNIESIIDLEELNYLLENVSKVSINEEVMDYLVEIINVTRNKKEIALGASPRASIAVFKASQAYSAINGRDYILPEDIKYVSPYVLNHRIIASGIKKYRGFHRINRGNSGECNSTSGECLIMAWALAGVILLVYLINKWTLSSGYINLDYRMEIENNVAEIGEEIQIYSIIENNKFMAVPFLEVSEKFPKGFNTLGNRYAIFIMPYQRVRRSYEIKGEKKEAYII